MNFSNISKYFFGLVAVLLLLPVVSFAQEQTGAVLAEVNIGEASFQKNQNEVNVSFSISNQASIPQSDIRYGIEILQSIAGYGEALVDRFIDPETISVNAGESIVKTIKYDSSGLAPGKYTLLAVARTTGGIVLGLTRVGEIDVTDSSALFVYNETCELAVAGDENTYMSDQGIDVSATEEILFSCKVKNFSNNEIQVVPVFETFRRTVYGEEVVTPESQNTPIAFAAGEEKRITLSVPKASEPQAYDSVMSLMSANSDSLKLHSNHALVHYVLRGESGTIQTVNFDKDEYKQGETMLVKMYWTGAADNFADSRSEESSQTENVSVAISVTGETGAACSSLITKSINPGAVIIEVPVHTDCRDPKALISLTDGNGKDLDSRTIEVDSPDVVADDTEGESPVVASGPITNPLVMFVILVFAAFSLYAVITFARHRKDGAVDASRLLTIALVILGGFMYSVPQVEAVTWDHVWSNNAGTYDMGVAVNANKLTFAPGEQITLNSTVWNISCSNNSVAIHRLTASLGGVTATLSDIDVNYRGNVYGSGVLTAPTTPGTYNIVVQIQTKARGEISSRNITITVPVSPAVGNLDSVNAASCSISGWAYDPDSSGSSINVHVYRDNSAFSGGTYVTSCAANSYRSDINSTYGISGSHGFNCVMPASYVGLGNHNLYVHALDINGAPNNVISGSPKALNCIPVVSTPTATITGTGCTIPVGGNSCSGNVTWSISNPTSPNVFNSTAATQYSSVAAGNNQAITLYGPSTTLQARNNSSVLASTNVTATCAGGSSWNGTTCAAIAPTVPAGTISASSCTIPVGSSSCNSNVSWTSQNFVGTPSVLQGSAQFSSQPSGSAVSRTATLTDRTFTIRDSGGTYTHSVNAVINCAPNSVVAGSVCLSLPNITIASNPNIVRSGNTAPIEISIEANYDLTCNLSGGIQETFTHSASATPTNYTRTTPPLTSARVVHIECAHTVYPAVTAEDEVRVDVIPTVQEV